MEYFSKFNVNEQLLRVRIFIAICSVNVSCINKVLNERFLKAPEILEP
jgi:hypothetical protein